MSADDPVVREGGDRRAPLPPNATEIAATVMAENREATRIGQRATSIIWERTQQVIAVAVCAVALAVAGILALRSDDPAAFVFLSSVANLVIGFYFGRTNHQRVGGVEGDVYGR